jgi:hypothetical protein
MSRPQRLLFPSARYGRGDDRVCPICQNYAVGGRDGFLPCDVVYAGDAGARCL